MDLKSFLAPLDGPAQDKFAKRCETSIGHLRNVICGTRKCGESLAIAIERESGGEVPCEEMRPDVDWAFIRGTAKKVNGSRRASTGR